MTKVRLWTGLFAVGHHSPLTRDNIGLEDPFLCDGWDEFQYMIRKAEGRLYHLHPTESSPTRYHIILNLLATISIFRVKLVMSIGKRFFI